MNRKRIDRIITESINRVLREAAEPAVASQEELKNDFTEWLMREENHGRYGGPVDKIGLAYQYYTEDNDDALYTLLQAYLEDIGMEDLDTESPEYFQYHEAARKVIDELGYYQFNDEPEDMASDELEVNDDFDAYPVDEYPGW